MKQRLWIVAAVVLGTMPVWAQPDNKGALAPSDEITAAELEKAIGGRTTLELKFKDLTTEEVTAQIAKSSGLRFVPPVGVAPNQPAAATWNGDVDTTDFWPALRKWGRAENVRLQSEFDVLQQRQKNEAAPPPPIAVEGETVAPEVMKAWQQQQMELMQRRSAELSRFNPNGTLSALYNANADLWNLNPGSQLIAGEDSNVWPCLVLATRFQRQQSFSLQKKVVTEKVNNATDKATPDALKPNQAPAVNTWGEEATEGGFLSDALSLDMIVYVEPKLQNRATVRVRVNQARDDMGESLLFDAQNRPSSGVSNMPYTIFSPQDSGISHRVQLRPRQAKGSKLAVLSGIVTIRYPMKLQEHEITNFEGAQKFFLNSTDLPIEGQLDPPHIENGHLRFKATATLNSDRGGLAIHNRWMRYMEDPNPDMNQPVLNQWFLPDAYTFLDSEGRTWKVGGSYGGRSGSFRGPDGKPIPVTSPPTPLPDDFTYVEERDFPLQLLPPNAPPGYQNQTSLPPEELAKVRFTKATFTTESDWRTLEVPFEFHDLPLPPR